MQDAVDRGWLYTRTASHFTGVTELKKLLLTALELADALAYLHSVDVMHGDLTGGNVLLHSSPITPTDPRGFIVKVWRLFPTLHTVSGNCMLLPCWLVHACINLWFL
jgi:serine/threonine protein kinase